MYLSEGLEDYSNHEGVSYMSFYDAKDVNATQFDAAKFEE